MYFPEASPAVAVIKATQAQDVGLLSLTLSDSYPSYLLSKLTLVTYLFFFALLKRYWGIVTVTGFPHERHRLLPSGRQLDSSSKNLFEQKVFLKCQKNSSKNHYELLCNWLADGVHELCYVWVVYRWIDADLPNKLRQSPCHTH